MKLLGRRLLLIPVKSADKTKGGILLPEVGQSEEQEGIVAAIGSGIKEATEYTKGSRVFLEMYKTIRVKHDDFEYLMVDQEAVIGVDVNGQFHPIGNRILLKATTTIERDGVIIRPSAYDHDKDSTICCTIHLLGSGIKNKKGERQPFDVKIGDQVFIEPFSGRDVDTAEGQYKLVTQDLILTKIEL